jgi:hypothetical protein
MPDPASPRLPELTLGEVLRGRPLRLSLARVLAFSGGPFDEPGWPQRNLHTDPGRARDAGLDGIIASGTQSEGLLIAFLGDVFGPDWYATGELDVRFLKPVAVDSVVCPELKLIAMAREDACVRLTAECWCATDDGVRVIDGTASCIVGETDAGPRS